MTAQTMTMAQAYAQGLVEVLHGELGCNDQIIVEVDTNGIAMIYNQECPKGCYGCGSICAVAGCRVCDGQELCHMCQKYGPRRR